MNTGERNMTMRQLIDKFNDAVENIDSLKFIIDAVKRQPELEKKEWTANDSNVVIGETYYIQSVGVYKIKGTGKGKISWTVKSPKDMKVLYQGQMDDTAESDEMILTAGDICYLNASADGGETLVMTLEQTQSLFEMMGTDLIQLQSSVDAMNERLGNALTGVDTKVDEAVEIVKDALGYVTPEMFGAVGDGVTDDTEAIQEAIDTGMNILLGRSKNYVISNELVLCSNTIFDMNHSVLMYKTQNKERNVILNIQNKSHIAICNGTLSSDGDSDSKKNIRTHTLGIFGFSAQNCCVYNMNFTNLGTSNCINGTEQVSFGLGSGDDKQDSCNNIVRDCVFDATTDSFNVRMCSPFKSVSKFHIYNNVVYHCLFKYSVKSCCEIAGNTTSECKIFNNVVLDCGTEAFDIDKNACYCEISHNVIEKRTGSDESSTTPFGGISVQTYLGDDKVDGFKSKGNIIKDNTILNSNGAGIFANSTEDCLIFNNRVYNSVQGIIVDSGLNYESSVIVSDNTLKGIQDIGVNCMSCDKISVLSNIIECVKYGIDISSRHGTGSAIIKDNDITMNSKGIYSRIPDTVIVNNTVRIGDKECSDSYKRGIYAISFKNAKICGNSCYTGNIRSIEVHGNTDGGAEYADISHNNTQDDESSSATSIVLTTGKIAKLLTVANSVNPYVHSSLVVDSRINLKF